MPTAKLEFKLPEEEDSFRLSQRGSDYYSFLFDLDNELRGWLKYGGCPYKTVDELMEHLREELREVPIWDIK